VFIFTKHQKRKFHYSFISRTLVCLISISLALGPTAAQAQSLNLLNLPTPGTMVLTSPAFNPAIVTGIKIYPDNPLQFDFIIDIGDDQLQGEALKKESQKLINYFMATLTVPEDEMWVNLSPYEKDRIIAEGLSYTEMGRDMLAQDYLLKQLTASLMYPEDDFGKEFWNRVYSKAQDKYGTTEIPMNTFNKIWIVPDEAVVYVHDTNVFVVENHLKVMLEEDYLALESNVGSTKHGLGNITKDDIEVVSGVSAEIIREVLLPEIEKEVNQGKNFANLRQMYNSMLLATWYKKNLKESLLGQIYADKNKVNGIELDDKEIKQKIYDRYVEAFEKGVYNYIKEDIDSVTQEVIPRKYFSGGLEDYLSENGDSRFNETTGDVPATLVAKAGRPHVTATMRGETLGDGGTGVSSPVELNEFWETRKGLSGDDWLNVELPIVLTLVAVREPVSMSMLVDISDKNEEQIRQVIKHWTPHLEIVRGEDNRYQMSAEMKSFVEGLDNREEGVDLKLVHGRIADHILLKDLIDLGLFGGEKSSSPISNEITINRTKVSIVQGDITQVKADAVVSPANTAMGTGVGVTGVFIRALSRYFQGDEDVTSLRIFPTPEELIGEDEYPIESAVVADVSNIPTNRGWKYLISGVVHYRGVPPTETNIKNTTKEVLRTANDEGVRSIAFTSFGTGIMGIEFSVSARQMLSAVREYLEENQKTSLRKIKFVLFSKKAMTPFGQELAKIGGEKSSSPVGGIDFNPNNINLSERGNNIQINFSVTDIQNLNLQSINGILPVIINISPLPSILPLLGLAPKEEEFELSSLN